jgi:hypothetical protein
MICVLATVPCDYTVASRRKVQQNNSKPAAVILDKRGRKMTQKIYFMK